MDILKKRTKGAARGFTLIEVLVVLAIMATLLGIGASVMKNATTAQGTDAGASVAEGVFNEARSRAKANGLGARVVIFDGGVESEEARKKQLRYLGIVRKNDNGTANIEDDIWNNRLVSQGVLLPPNVYFNANLSETNSTGALPTMDVMIPGFKKPQQCYYYEFNGEGYLSNPVLSNGAQAYFVVQKGTLFPTSPLPRVQKDSRDIEGFVIWSRGNTVRLDTPDQLSKTIFEFKR